MMGVPRALRAEWCAGVAGGKKMGGGRWEVHIGDLLPPPPIIFFCGDTAPFSKQRFFPTPPFRGEQVSCILGADFRAARGCR